MTLPQRLLTPLEFLDHLLGLGSERPPDEQGFRVSTEIEAGPVLENVLEFIAVFSNVPARLFGYSAVVGRSLLHVASFRFREIHGLPKVLPECRGCAQFIVHGDAVVGYSRNSSYRDTSEIFEVFRKRQQAVPVS